MRTETNSGEPRVRPLVHDVSGLALGLVPLALALPAAAEGNVRGALLLAGFGITFAYLELVGGSDADDGESGADAGSSAVADAASAGESEPYVIDPNELEPVCASCGRAIDPDRERCADCGVVGRWRK